MHKPICRRSAFPSAHRLFGPSADFRAKARPPLPKVRTVTAFVRLDRANYQAQVAEALKMLRAAKDALTKAGYEVETIRITTQPFPEYTKGLTADQAHGILPRL